MKNKYAISDPLSSTQKEHFEKVWKQLVAGIAVKTTQPPQQKRMPVFSTTSPKAKMQLKESRILEEEFLMSMKFLMPVKSKSTLHRGEVKITRCIQYLENKKDNALLPSREQALTTAHTYGAAWLKAALLRAFKDGHFSVAAGKANQVYEIDMNRFYEFQGNIKTAITVCR